MYILGLTGGIASGKSAVSGILSSLGAYIIDADQIAREIVEPGKSAWREIVSHFGEKILLPDNEIDRTILGNLVFKDEEARAALEDITHRLIKKRVFELVETAKQEKQELVVLDVPLLIEAGWHEMVDEVWVVYVTREIQLKRLIHRNGLSAEQAEARIVSQMDLKKKLGYADVVIDNNGDLENTKLQVLAAWQKIKAAK